MPQTKGQKRPRTPTLTDGAVDHLALPSNIEPVYKTILKVNKALVKAKHHSVFMNAHLINKTTPTGLRPRVTFQLPEVDASTILQWEEAHVVFATTLVAILKDYYRDRVLYLNSQILQLEEKLKLIADEKQQKWITDRLPEEQTKLEKELTERRERKTAGSRGTNNQASSRPATPIQLEVPQM